MIFRAIFALCFKQVQIVDNRLPFSGHAKGALAGLVPILLVNFERDIVGAIINREFIDEFTPTLTLIKGVIRCVGDSIRYRTGIATRIKTIGSIALAIYRRINPATGIDGIYDRDA